jgi:predicted nucleotidyltransferase
MTAPSLSQQSLEQARDVVLRHASVEAAYLLGVAATSRLWSESDVDVAVLARRGTAISVAGRLSSTASLERIFARTVDVGVLGPSNVVYA